MKNESEERARAILAEAVGSEVEAIAEDASIESLEAWDSLAHMRIVLALEKALGQQLKPQSVAEIGSLRDIARLLDPSGTSLQGQ